MQDEPNRLLKWIDQFLPFLAAAPDWLKYWIYLLIFINIITIAAVVIFYLKDRLSIDKEASLGRFSLDQPKDDEEIPLSKGQARILEGKFPKVPGPLKEGDGVAVEVRTLPEGRLVPQNDKASINTFDGRWSYEAITFDGEGDYAINVVATLSGRSRVQRIVVKCRNKSELYRELIEADRVRRNAPKLVVPPRDSVSLEEVYQKITEIQDRFIEKYLSNNQGEALEAIFKSFDVLDPALVLFPDDRTLQASRAFFMKNYAMIMRDRNQPDEFRRSLAEAEAIFKAIRDKDSNDANAWNGLGSVALLRNQPELALYYIDKSLEIYPENPHARKDREAAFKLLKDAERAAN